MTSRPEHEGPPVSAPAVRQVGPYTLLAKIGEGGMGVVHLARRGEDGARVALKVLRPHIVGDDEARQRLAREVSSLGRIRSRWVAEILDADPWAPVPYVATRYVPGLSLHDHVLHEGPIGGADLLWFAGGLAEGLASVHSVGVLHRDVKPSNVLMEGRTPILIDFGLARVADDPRLTHTGWLLGTPGYLAPEILYGDDASVASDLHSWAATVAYAAIGRAPFGGGPAMAVMDRVRRGEHDLSGLTGPLRDVVVAALDPEPDRRPSLEGVLAWLRPQTTRPAPLLAPPPTLVARAAPEADDHEDPFDAPLLLAAQAHDQPTPAPAPDPVTVPLTLQPSAPSERPVAPTLVDRVEPRSRPAHQPVHQPVHQPYAYPAPLGAHEPWPEPPPPVPAGERARRLTLVAAGAVATGAALAAAPYVVLAVTALVVWLLRSGSLAASAVGRRRSLRGRRWYDAPQLLLQAPWRLVQSVPGAALLVGWAAGLGAAAALVCYALAATAAVTLFAAGVTAAVGLWSGPGSHRLRGPLDRVVHPVARRVPHWLLATAVVLAFALLTGTWIEANGTDWLPAPSRPFAGR